jgi:hypothetical protein
MSARDFDESLTCLQKVPDHRRQEVLAIVCGLLRHDAAIFTWQELLRFAQRESLTHWELAGAIEYCWLCGWCGYDPRTGNVLGGYMEALRMDGQEQDELIEGRLGR